VSPSTVDEGLLEFFLLGEDSFVRQNPYNYREHYKAAYDRQGAGIST
jgi:hypothetical protein